MRCKVLLFSPDRPYHENTAACWDCGHSPVSGAGRARRGLNNDMTGFFKVTHVYRNRGCISGVLISHKIFIKASKQLVTSLLSIVWYRFLSAFENFP